MLPLTAETGSAGWGIPVPAWGDVSAYVSTTLEATVTFGYVRLPMPAVEHSGSRLTVLLGSQPQLHEGRGMLILTGDGTEMSGTGRFTGTLPRPCQVVNSKWTTAAPMAHQRQGNRGTNTSDQPSFELGETSPKGGWRKECDFSRGAGSRDHCLAGQPVL